MKKTNIKIRKCIVCNEQKNKEQLIRIVKSKDGTITIDESGKLNGRGAYICKNKECIDKSIKNSLLNRHLKTKVDDKVYEALETM